MIVAAATGQSFPKSSRLLKRRDFQFRPYRRFQSDHFLFLYSSKGSGRVGISISKKVLRRAIARNRVRRLLRESFRLSVGRLRTCDVHVIGGPKLTGSWEQLKRQDIDREFGQLVERLDRPAQG